MRFPPADLTDTYHAELTADSWDITYFGATIEAAEAAAKILGAKRTRPLVGNVAREGEPFVRGTLAYTAIVGADLRARKGNERNEAGIARYYRAVASVEATGATLAVYDGVIFPATGRTIRWHGGRNPYLTRAAFEAMLAAT